VNEQIRITPVRVVDDAGEMLGVIPTAEAQQMAVTAGLDLVEVAPNVRPPVCRIMDYGKFKYEQKKKFSKSAKQHHSQIKEIRLRPKTGKHDVDFKVERAKMFLGQGHKVKVNVLFKGRENAHHERGREMLDEIIIVLEGLAKVESPPRMEGGRIMSMVLAPKSR